MAVEFFFYKFSDLFQNMYMDKLSEQFIAYQVLSDTDILLSVKTDVGLEPDDSYRVDVLWAYLNSMRYLEQIFLYSIYFLKLLLLSSPYRTLMPARNEFSISLTRTKHQVEVHSYLRALCHLSLPLKLIYLTHWL